MKRMLTQAAGKGQAVPRERSSIDQVWVVSMTAVKGHYRISRESRPRR